MGSILLLSLNLYFALVLGVSGLAKLDSRLSFEVTLSKYGFLPSWTHRPVSYVFPWVELIVATGMAFGFQPLIFGGLTAVMFVVFLAIESLLVILGKKTNCGCYGAVLGRRVDSASIVTSGVLASLACLNFFISLEPGESFDLIRLSTASACVAVLLLIAYRVAERNLHNPAGSPQTTT